MTLQVAKKYVSLLLSLLTGFLEKCSQQRSLNNDTTVSKTEQILASMQTFACNVSLCAKYDLFLYFPENSHP